MKTIRIFIMMSALLALFGCRDDDSVNGDDGGIIFNAVAIDNVSEPSEDGLVTIALTFRDEGGNELKMAAGGLYSYLDPGYYNLAPAVAGRFDAVFELTVGASPVALDEGRPMSQGRTIIMTSPLSSRPGGKSTAERSERASHSRVIITRLSQAEAQVP